jgi:hypothetical protein
MTDQFFVVDTRVKPAAATRIYTVVMTTWLRVYWYALRTYQNGDKVRAPSAAGFAFQANAGGEAGSFEPAWNKQLGGQTTDGSITWTTIAASGNAVDAINSVAWSQVSPPDGTLTISSPQNTVEEASATFAGGTSGSKYRVRATVTTAGGQIYPFEFDLEIQ